MIYSLQIRSVDLKSSRVIMKENEKMQVTNRLLEWKIKEAEGEMTDDQYDRVSIIVLSRSISSSFFRIYHLWID